MEDTAGTSAATVGTSATIAGSSDLSLVDKERAQYVERIQSMLNSAVIDSLYGTSDVIVVEKDGHSHFSKPDTLSIPLPFISVDGTSITLESLMHPDGDKVKVETQQVKLLLFQLALSEKFPPQFVATLGAVSMGVGRGGSNSSEESSYPAYIGQPFITKPQTDSKSFHCQQDQCSLL